MDKLVLRRLSFALPLALGIIFFSFLGLRMSENSRAPQPRYDLPAFARQAWGDSLDYLRQAARGDLGWASTGRGQSRRRAPVSEILADTYGKSLGLLIVALAIAATAGVSAGLFAALRERSPLALATLVVTLLGISTPTFFAALLWQVAEITFYRSAGFRLLPVAGFGWDAHLVLPALVLAARPLAHITRVTLVSLRQVLDQDYIRTAVAKGLPQPLLWQRHALRSAAVPILTGVGVSLRFALGSLPVVEYFFDWPGLGATLLAGIRQQQATLVVTLALALGLTFMGVNLLLDVLCRYLDPRLREEALR